MPPDHLLPIPKTWIARVGVIKYPDGYLGRRDDNDKISRIKKIFTNGPATILITVDGKKVVVKCEKGTDNDPVLGLYMVLLKYLTSSKIYSDLVTYIFDCHPVSYYEMQLKAIAALTSLIGAKTLDDIVEIFVSSEFD